jgi:hypothetical protein
MYGKIGVYQKFPCDPDDIFMPIKIRLFQPENKRNFLTLSLNYLIT